MADDIVKRLDHLLHDLADGHFPMIETRDDVRDAADEIKRLRAAGDLLAAYVVLNVPPTAMCFAAVERWHEARRD